MHYDQQKENFIFQLEKKMTVCEMVGAMTYNIEKVKNRIGNKDELEKEERKIQTYTNYRRVLFDLERKGFGHIRVNLALSKAGLKFDY